MTREQLLQFDHPIPGCADVGTEPPTTRYSVHVDSIDEIARYKWIESERAGYDLGDKAVREWIAVHWCGYLRARWLEHLKGTRFWIELDRGDYGLLKRAFHNEQPLLNWILEHLMIPGKENLDVIHQAHLIGHDRERVIAILAALDINSRRLLHKFDLNGEKAKTHP
jgi:hypothetical protein